MANARTNTSAASIFQWDRRKKDKEFTNDQSKQLDKAYLLHVIIVKLNLNLEQDEANQVQTVKLASFKIFLKYMQELA